MTQTAETLETTLTNIGPTCIKHHDGRFGVLWYAEQGSKMVPAVYPRIASSTPLKAIKQPPAVASCYRSVRDVWDCGWRLD